MLSNDPLYDRDYAKVLVVGAGPTGLTLAASLGRLGVPVDIVDRKAAPNDQSKALAINPVAKTQLDVMFGSNNVGERANLVSRLNIMTGTSKRLSSINLNHLRWPHHQMRVQTQHETEQDLVNLAVKAGVTVQWSTRVDAVVTSENGLEAHVIQADGTTTRHRYDYVIGCDGKYSVVRPLLDAQVTSRSYDTFLALADYKLKIRLDEDAAYYFVYKDTFFVFVPLGDSVWRVVVKHAGTPPKTPSTELVTKLVQEKFGEDIFVGENLWFSVAPLYISFVDRLGDGRIFIAGDAAHLYSPIGGTGMNTGIGDAINLGWKLGFVIQGLAKPEKLLQSYQEERLPVIRSNAEQTDQMTLLISGQLEPHFANPFLPLMSNRPALKYGFPTAISGYGLQYPPVLNTDGAETTTEVGRLSMALCPLMTQIADEMPELEPRLTVFHFVPHIPSAAARSPLVSDVLKGVRDIFVVPLQAGGNPKAAPKTQTFWSDVIVLELDPNEWSQRAERGPLQAVRPDGITYFQGQFESIDLLIKQLSVFLREK